IVISRGDPAENEQIARSFGLSAPVLLQRTREVARAYGVLETPAAFQLDAAGRIAAGPAISANAVLALIHQSDRAMPDDRSCPGRKWENDAASTRSLRG